jgi:hypothetical protein
MEFQRIEFHASTQLYRLSLSTLSKFSTVFHKDGKRCLTTTGSIAFNAFDDIHAFAHIAKHHMLAIQPRSLLGAQKELRSIGTGT